MMASYSSVLQGKEDKSFPPPHKLFPSFSMEEQNKKVQDFNFEEQSTNGLKKVKANWGNDSIFGLYEHSSSSGLSSPFGSELGSTETDETEIEEDEDFIAQLTRQMADYMLKDDDEEEEVSVDENDVDENRVPNYTVQTSNQYGLAGNWSNYNSREICYYNQESLGTYVKPVADSVNQGNSSNTVFYSSDDLKRPIHVYHLKDQPTTAKQKPSKGKRVKGTTTESVQKLKIEKNNMQSTLTKKQTLGGDKIHHPIQSNGAGMRAIFLGASGSKNGSSGGTGVFLPRRINPNPNPTATAPKKKSGNSTVLIPARVLQALQQHFNHMDALSQSNTCAVSPSHLPKNDAENETEGFVSKENQHSEDQTSVVNDQEMQLPQEWTY
ncbi:uncharacterized protein LOC132605888 [Lycium barbarum]|uniref:uncharacterized protein LOC132605888 n=1 Tax=Lycium barbarum TaxID=112863 RepID=UPI00293E8F06|nr:uncharacterized protein LOC132605888 [Lycium barbarum]